MMTTAKIDCGEIAEPLAGKLKTVSSSLCRKESIDAPHAVNIYENGNREEYAAVPASVTKDGECASPVALDNIIMRLDAATARLDAALRRLNKLGTQNQIRSTCAAAPESSAAHREYAR